MKYKYVPLLFLFFLSACATPVEEQNKEPIIETKSSISDTVVKITESLVNFKGVTSTAGTPKTGNLSINLYKNSFYPGVICPNTDSGSLYYVNIGNDNYLYELKKGVSSLILDKRVKFINYWNDKLYFILCSDIDVYFEKYNPGKLYEYDLETKELAQLDSNVVSFNIDQNGIYYKKYGGARFHLPFGENESQKYDIYSIIIHHYKEYDIGMYFNEEGNFAGYKMENLENGNEYILTDSTVHFDGEYVSGDRFYFSKHTDKFINCYIDLISGEQKDIVYNSQEIDTFLPQIPLSKINDYVDVNGVLYVSFPYPFCEYDIKNNSYEEILLLDESLNILEGSPCYLYTDGVSIYPILLHSNGNFSLGVLDFYGYNFTGTVLDKEVPSTTKVAIFKELGK